MAINNLEDKTKKNIHDFWNNFNSEKTLYNIMCHFIQNYEYEDKKRQIEFCVKILGKNIGKEFEVRKILELFNKEITQIDIQKIQRQKETIYEKESGNVTIFDIDKMDGIQFEVFLGTLLEYNNFVDVRVTRGSGDQGGDVTAKLDGEKLVFQAKRYSINHKVSNSAVQEVFASIAWYNANKGIVVTNSRFTRGARDLAKINNIELWDRQKLSELIKNYNQKLINAESKLSDVSE